MTASDAPERVRSFLGRHGLADEIVVHDTSTKTAAQAAEALGCELGQVVKSLVFVADGRPVLCLIAGDRRGDAAAIAREAGAASARLADPDTVLSSTGYPVGSVTPFVLPEGVLVLLDESLQRFDIVFPAAGTSSSMVRIRFSQLADLTSGRVGAISR